jgi:hypothetical protein
MRTRTKYTGEMTRRLLLISLALIAFLAAAASASDGAGFSARFTVQFPKGHPASNAPCDPDAFCGVGHVNQFGNATITIVDDSFAEIPDSPCLAVTRVEEIDLEDGAGWLVLESAGTFCRPGGSGDSNAGPSTYGSPGRFELAFTVDGAESGGVFAGATGSGTETMNVQGGIGVWQLSGEVTLS